MLMIAAILIPVAAGIAISAIPMEDRTRKILYACSVLLTDAVAVLAAMGGGTLRLSELSEGVAIIFRADTLGRCFLAVTILLYTSVLFYSFESVAGKSYLNRYIGHFVIDACPVHLTAYKQSFELRALVLAHCRKSTRLATLGYAGILFGRFYDTFRAQHVDVAFRCINIAKVLSFQGIHLLAIV